MVYTIVVIIVINSNNHCECAPNRQLLQFWRAHINFLLRNCTGGSLKTVRSKLVDFKLDSHIEVVSDFQQIPHRQHGVESN